MVLLLQLFTVCLDAFYCVLLPSWPDVYRKRCYIYKACMLWLMCLIQNDMAEQVMMELDSDLDGTLNFLEYCSMITSLSMILHIIVSGDLS